MDSFFVIAFDPVALPKSTQAQLVGEPLHHCCVQTGRGLREQNIMAWTYRIVDHGQHFALHEVCLDDQGNPRDWVRRSIDFACDLDDGPEGIISSLEQALVAAKAAPSLVVRGDRLVQRGDGANDQ